MNTNSPQIESPSSIRIAVAAFFFVSGFSFASWASRIPALQQQLHLNNAELGSTLFALPLGLMLTIPLTSYLLSRYSSRYILLTGSAMFSTLLCLLGFVTNTWQFVIVLFFFGCSRNLMNISVNTQSVGVQILYQRSIIASFHGVWSLAGFLAAAIGSFMISNDITPARHFLVIGGITFLIMAFTYPNTLRNDVHTDNKVKKPVFALPDRTLLKLGVIAFCCMAAEGTMYDWSGIYFQKAVNAPKALLNLGYVAFMFTMSAGRFSGDWLVNRIGVKKVMQISGCLIAGGLLTAVIFPYLISSTFGFLLAGFGVSCVIPLVMGLAGKNLTMGAGPAIAAVSTVSYFGFLFGPPVIGYIAQAANLRWSLAFVSLSGILIFVLVSKIKIAK